MAPSAARRSPVLAPGATAGSGNIHLLTNLPKTGAFAPERRLQQRPGLQGRLRPGGNYNGFTVYDIKNPRKTREVKQVLCPGSQNDISVHGNLLVLSVDSRRSDDTCTSRALSTAASNPDRWQTRRPWQPGTTGRAPDLRHQRPGQPDVRQERPHRLRLAHPHAGAVG
jgi:hypothetical protein